MSTTSTRGRKALPPVETVEPAINHAQIRQDLDAADSLAPILSAVDMQFGDGLVYDRTRVVLEARFFMAQSAEAMLEAGKRLILLKEHEPHGEFVQIAESSLNLDLRSAERMMKAALKYLSPALASKSTTLSTLGKSKLFELMTLDDDVIAELADGGTVANIDLDEIDRMSVRELRAALRGAKEDASAKDRLLADKNRKLDELQARPVVSASWDDTAKALIDESDALFVIVQEHVARLLTVQQAMVTAEFGNQDEVDKGLRACAVAFGDKLARTAQMVSELRGIHDKTLGAFAESLDSQPVETLQQAA